MNKSQPWIPLWVDKWLFGSTRDELDLAERAIWIDFLCLAAKGNGWIRASEEMPYSLKRLAGLLNCDEKILEAAIKKFQEMGKIELDVYGAIKITNWEKYQLSPSYVRWKRWKDRQEQTQNVCTPTQSVCEQTPSVCGQTEGVCYINNNIENKKEKNIYIKKIDSNMLDSQSVDKVISIWNNFAEKHRLPKVKGVSKGSARERHLIARIKEGLDFEELFKAAEEQPFLLGDNPSGWVATFDWYLWPGNVQKVLEKSYKKKSKSSTIEDVKRRFLEGKK